MVNLAVEVCGVKFRFPTMISAGPVSKSGDAIRKAGQQYGLGAVVTKTISRAPGRDPQPYMAKAGQGLLNHAWADVGIERWLERELPLALEGGLPVIASVNDPDPAILGDMAYRLQEVGASMIEIPMHGGDVAAARAKVAAVKKAIHVPLVIKVGPDIPDVPNYALAMVQAGADVMSGINTLGPCLSIDVDSGRPLLGTAGGIGHLSGAPLKPLALAYAAELRKALDVPVWGGGGIKDGQDALEFFMVGCCCVHVHTAAILSGLGVFEKIVNQVESFLARKGLASLNEIVGITTKHLRSDQSSVPVRARVGAELCNGCGACNRSCLYGAVRMEEKASIEEAACVGCGLCASLCPTGAITLFEIS